ncbi:MGMT family protein [Shewanella colwelliana]|nr:MGMT family protein [Shewanella colwelliana]MDX1282239.1 MGMT family protein [Shewanella colwelliana]GIU42174.1 methylated-DNA--protein-cysteine methyltransferase [Shewanella colwelliana]
MEPSALSPMAKIWHVVAIIPQGKVCSYGKVADLAGLPGRARYVSKALKMAPDTLQLPWHRVINSQGKISFAPNSEPFIEQMQKLRSEDIEVNCGKIKLSNYEWRPNLATLVFELPF